MSNDLRRLRKVQQHNPAYKAWNLRGAPDFTSFNPAAILAGDTWFGSVEDGVTVNNILGNLKVFKGDWVIAIEDNPGLLNYETFNAGKWDIIRRIPADQGSKFTGRDGGRFGWTSIDDDYQYVCTRSGEPETVSGAGDGTAIWKRHSLQNT
jgi:hypothetical protein